MADYIMLYKIFVIFWLYDNFCVITWPNDNFSLTFGDDIWLDNSIDVIMCLKKLVLLSNGIIAKKLCSGWVITFGLITWLNEEIFIGIWLDTFGVTCLLMMVEM
jgi:hypothetical protein